MAVNRYYSSAAVPTALSAGINNSATSIQVDALTGYPTSYPYTAILDEGTSSEEVVTVTNAAGTVLTVTRGVDGTTALSHSLGATVRHGISARDFREPQEHIDSTAAHGATGAVVGTTNTQTLTNKTLTAPNISAPVMTGGGSWAGSPSLTTPTIADLTNMTHDHSSNAEGGVLPVPRGKFQFVGTEALVATVEETITLTAQLYSKDGGPTWAAGTPTLVTLPAFNADWEIKLRGVFQNGGANTGYRSLKLRRVGDAQLITEAFTSGPGGTGWPVVASSEDYEGAASQQFYITATSELALNLAEALVSFKLIKRT